MPPGAGKGGSKGPQRLGSVDSDRFKDFWEEATIDRKTERQFQAANAAIESAVAALMSKVDKMRGQWEAVAPTYILQGTLLALCDGMTKLIDDPILADLASPAALRLSNALADYRDSLPVERHAY